MPPRAAAPVLATFALALLASSACDRLSQQGEQAPTCPPCECACAEAGAAEGQAEAASAETPPSESEAGATPDPQPPTPPAETADPEDPYAVSDIVASANRKMMHGDGVGCLAELERVAKLAPKLVSHLEITRAQCEMLTGKCQEGKQKIVDFYMKEMAMGKELAEKTAENIASMRCKGGNSSDRDQLLAAYYDLQDGAYMNKRDVDYCKKRVEIIETLAPKVKPRDAEDSMITGGRQALFHTSAMCFARAGDCTLAYDYYTRLFPPEALDALQDPQLRAQTLRESFDSGIVLCEGKLQGQP